MTHNYSSKLDVPLVALPAGIACGPIAKKKLEAQLDGSKAG
jgi:hypothetical protein